MFKKKHGGGGPPPPPPPMMGGPPPPPAPGKSSAPPKANKNRGALLSDIGKGAKLKKTTTNDRSAPDIGGGKQPGGGGGRGGGPMMPGGMFGGGPPKLPGAGNKTPMGGPPKLPGAGSKPPMGGPPKLPGSGSKPSMGGPPKLPGSGSKPPMGGPPKLPGAGSKPPMGGPLKLPGSGSKPPMGGPPKLPGSGSKPPMGGPPKLPGSGSKPPMGGPLKLPAGGKPGKAPPPAKPTVYAKCLYDYSPVQEDELALTAGKVVTVSKQESDGWWEGELDSRQGRFPGNYVEICDPPLADPPTAASPMLGGSPGAKALFDYTAQTATEISIATGTEYRLIRKDGEWWEVEGAGEHGFAPANYFKEIPPKVIPTTSPKPSRSGGSVAEALKAVPTSLGTKNKPPAVVAKVGSSGKVSSLKNDLVAAEEAKARLAAKVADAKKKLSEEKAKLKSLESKPSGQGVSALEAESAANVMEEELDSLKATLAKIHDLATSLPASMGSFA